MGADPEQQVWETVHRHIRSIFERDPDTYEATTSDDLSLYEWFITPHRQDGLPFHRWMIAHGGMREGDAAYHYELLEPRLQLYGDTAIVSYTFFRSTAGEGVVSHSTHNESRVLIRQADGAWKVVHVHKSPAWVSPIGGSATA